MAILEQPQLIHLDPKSITFNPENTNTHSGPDFEKLIQSVKEHGVFNPPTIRMLPGGIPQTIAGEGRVRAAVIAELDTIPVLNRGIVDDKVARLFLHIDNAVRNYDLINEAVGLAQLFDDGVSMKDLKRQFAIEHGQQRVQDLVGVGHFDHDIIQMIRDDIQENNRKEFWNYSIFQSLLPLRTEIKHHRVTSSELSQYSYKEVKVAVEKLIAGEINDFQELREYTLKRRNLILKKTVNKKIQLAVQEELAKANEQIELQVQQRIAGLEKKQIEEFDQQVAALKEQIASMNTLNEKLARDISKRPDKVEEKEQELFDASEQLRKQRLLFEEFTRKQEFEIEKITSKIQREQEAKYQIEYQRKIEELEREFEENKKNLEAYLMKRDDSRQLKAVASFQSTVARLTELLAQTQELGLMMLSTGFVQGFEWISRPEILALSAQIVATSQTTNRIQNKLQAVANNEETFERSM